MSKAKGGDKKREALQVRLRELESEIAEVLKRVPAHSAKPPVMQELIQLEDERDELTGKLASVNFSR
jgi:predicted  nucleic acid-binding Zn-ribbon protein